MAVTGFCQEVLEHIPRATRAERTAIQAELEAHLADHRDARMEEGLDYREALLSATRAMGDPAEVGRALNDQLSPFWLGVGRSFWLVLVVCCLALSLSVDPVVRLARGAAVRAAPALVFDLAVDRWNSSYTTAARDLEEKGYTLREDVDISMTLGNEEVRVCRLYLDPTPGNSRAAAALVLYNRDLLGYASDDLRYITFQGQREPGWTEWGESVSTGLIQNIPVYPGDTCLTLIYKRFGEELTLQVPLPWEVEP